jgi:LacI family transcriptional regulator
MSATLTDVAKRSGVSTATVSRVLNNKMVMPIAPATIERIKKAAAELEYKPNLQARALATGKTHTLGLYSTEMTDPHFAQMLEAMEAKAASLGYHLLVSSSLEVVARKGRVDGCVILGTPENPDFANLSRQVTTVFVYNAAQLRPNLVGWSDEEGMQLAVQHLVGLGHRQFVALFCYGEEKRLPLPNATAPTPTVHCPRATLAQHLKVSGFRSAVLHANVAATECWEAVTPDQIAHGYQVENGYQAIHRLLQQGAEFTAIVARNDFLALGALRALREAGLSVPGQVSVIGYTDSIQALCADPLLTSVRTPIAEAGALAIETLIESITEGNSSFQGIILPTSLTVRQSCASAPATAP